jgi:cysteine desulfurase
MTEKTIYLDNAASTQPDPAVIEAINEALTVRWGNPSSAHEVGSKARTRVEEARARVAALMGCVSDEVYFTSGGTEADNWALLGVLDYWRAKKNHLITVATEHHAVIDTAKWWRERGGDVTILPVDSQGLLDPQDVARAITPQTAIVSVMHVNNELGVVQDVAAIGAICREHGVTFHSDCVQSFGKLRFTFGDLNADLASISSHKIYGPKGVGALIIRRGTRITPRFLGGSQERSLRTGTENAPGIVGFGKAAELCQSHFADEIPRLINLRDHLETRILSEIPDARVNGSREKRGPVVLNVSFPGCDGEALLIALDQRGFCVSTGSACSAGAIGASHVLMALGLDVMVAQSALRFSVGRFNTQDDIDALMKVLPDLVSRQRQQSRAMFAK